MGLEIDNRLSKKHLLNHADTIEFFTQQSTWKTLSKTTNKSTNFTEGQFYTLLPANAHVENILKFPCGGIIPSIPLTPAQKTPHPQKIVTMEAKCAELLWEYLQQKTRIIIIAEPLDEAREPDIGLDNIAYSVYQDEVYHILYPSNSLDDVYNAVWSATTVWNAFILLTSFPTRLPPTLDLEIFEYLTKQTQGIVTSAYDGESFIFWEKQPATDSNPRAH